VILNRNLIGLIRQLSCEVGSTVTTSRLWTTLAAAMNDVSLLM